ncbi:MAG: secretin [Nitrosomonadales bacterium]|nr:secretin [Nitrosomonadales bacterium]
MEVVTLQYRSAEEILPVVRTMLDRDGAASGMNNQLILRTSPANLAEIRVLLQSMDTPPRRLRITVLQDVDSTTLNRLREISGSVAVGRNARIGIAAGAAGGLQVGVGQGANQVQARMVDGESAGVDHKSQQVQVLEGARALVRVGQDVPTVQRQIIQSPWQMQVIESTQYRDVGSGFYVVPRLNGERVTLEVISQNDSLVQPQSGNVVTQIQQVKTEVSGRLGEWLVLGELGRQSSEDSHTWSGRNGVQVRERRSVLLKVDEIK